VTDQSAASEDRISPRAAHDRRLAALVMAAAAERAGFVVISGVPLSGRRGLLQAIADIAEADFQIVEIANAGGPRLAGRATAASRDGAAAAPLFIIDDAAQPSRGGLRDLCATAPLSSEWATMLSVRVVLITRFSIAELDFLAPRVTACFPFLQVASDRVGVAASALATMPAGGGGASRVERPRPGVATSERPPPSRPRAAGRVAAQSLAPAGKPGGRDLRRCALLVYLAVVGVLGACYLALQTRPDHLPPAGVAAAFGHSSPAGVPVDQRLAK
jgi:hypothetical protein